MCIGCKKISDHVGRISNAVEVGPGKTHGTDGRENQQNRPKYLRRQPGKHLAQCYG